MGKKENKKERRKLILRVKNGNEKLGHKGVLIIILMIRTGLLVWDAETNLKALTLCLAKALSSQVHLLLPLVWILCPDNCKQTNNNRSYLCHCRLFLRSGEYQPPGIAEMLQW